MGECLPLRQERCTYKNGGGESNCKKINSKPLLFILGKSIAIVIKLAIVDFIEPEMSTPENVCVCECVCVWVCVHGSYSTN